MEILFHLLLGIEEKPQVSFVFSSCNNIIFLFILKIGNTFLHILENMSPEVLREVKSAFEDICELKQKITTVVSALQKSENLTENLERAVKSVKSLEELEIIVSSKIIIFFSIVLDSRNNK